MGHAYEQGPIHKETDQAGMINRSLEILERFGIHDIYRASVEACVRDLALDTATSARLFGDRLGAAA